MTVQSGARERGVGRSNAERPRRCSFWAAGRAAAARRGADSGPGARPARRNGSRAPGRRGAGCGRRHTARAVGSGACAVRGLPTVDQECAVLDDDQAVAPLPPRVVRAARVTLERLLRDPVEDRVRCTETCTQRTCSGRMIVAGSPSTRTVWWATRAHRRRRAGGRRGADPSGEQRPVEDRLADRIVRAGRSRRVPDSAARTARSAAVIRSGN